ncbi:zinc ribbon domain-containing protein [Metallosphaera hakonensis]|uniref:zinc ribbon domain-containing protein n=1 Tax=Metallosphaera hakonensis TaxID=79601 RepID=UPI0014430B93|nr:zinc ribbon domain-containing protein [Metallosphaera hakonensis]
MKICPKCGYSVPDYLGVCPNCGTSLQDMKACPKCGFLNQQQMKFCTNCGANLDLSPPPPPPSFSIPQYPPSGPQYPPSGINKTRSTKPRLFPKALVILLVIGILVVVVGAGVAMVLIPYYLFHHTTSNPSSVINPPTIVNPPPSPISTPPPSSNPPPSSSQGTGSSENPPSGLIHYPYINTPYIYLFANNSNLIVVSDKGFSPQGVIFPVEISGDTLVISMVAYVYNGSSLYNFTRPVAYNPGVDILTGNLSGLITVNQVSPSALVTMWGQGGGANARLFFNGTGNYDAMPWVSGGGNFTYIFVNHWGYLYLSEAVVNGQVYKVDINTWVPWSEVDGIAIVPDNGILIVKSFSVNGNTYVS